MTSILLFTSSFCLFTVKFFYLIFNQWKNIMITLKTTLGDIVIELDYDKAPVTAKNSVV